jgi:predicted phosphodiesterase
MSESTTVAILADVHGNLPALERVDADIVRRGIAAVINLGDHASGPLWPSETVALLMARSWFQIAGNCDRLVATHPAATLGASDRFAFDRLAPAQRAWLGALPATATLADSIVAFHGTPNDDSSYLLETVESRTVRLARPGEIARRLAGSSSGVMLCGHSHIPRVVRLGDTRIINPGSVGLPAYDSGGTTPHRMESGSPDARYAVLERRDAEWIIELVSVPYDNEAAAVQAERNERPDWASALRTGFVT